MPARRKIRPTVRRDWLGPVDNARSAEPLSPYATEVLAAAAGRPLQLFRAGWAQTCAGPFYWASTVRALHRRGYLAAEEGIVDGGRGMRLYATREGRDALAHYSAALEAQAAMLAGASFL